MIKSNSGTRYTNPLNKHHWIEQDGQIEGGDYLRHRVAKIHIALLGALGLQRIIERTLSEDRNFETQGQTEHHGLTPFLTECLLCAQHALLDSAHSEIEHLSHDKHFLNATKQRPDHAA